MVSTRLFRAGYESMWALLRSPSAQYSALALYLHAGALEEVEAGVEFIRGSPNHAPRGLPTEGLGSPSRPMVSKCMPSVYCACTYCRAPASGSCTLATYNSFYRQVHGASAEHAMSVAASVYMNWI